MSNNPRLKFRYVIVKHSEDDYTINEAYTDEYNKVLAINGEPYTLRGYSVLELQDNINVIHRDIKAMDNMIIFEGDCERLYDNYDRITFGSFDYNLDMHQPSSKVIPFKR